MGNDNIQLFEDQPIRTAWVETEEEWYFSIVDVVGVLAESKDPTSYWRKLKQRLKEEGNESMKKAAAPEKADRKPEMDISSEKSKGKDRGTVLGQPVRRENPNRITEKQMKDDKSAAGTGKEAPKMNVTEKESWADALQKASDAISQEN